MEWTPQPRQAAIALRQRVILLAGLPGSGKTTVAEQLESFGWVRVNQDTLGSRRACEDALVAALAAGQEVVVDRCNFDLTQRSTFVNLAHRFGAMVIALQLTVPVHECIRRAKARPNHPTLTGENTAAIIERFARDFVGVHPSEGIEEVYTAANQVEVGQFVSYVGPAQQSTPGLPGPASRLPPISQSFPGQQPQGFPGQQQRRHAPHFDHRRIPDFPETFRPGPQQPPPYVPPPLQNGRRPNWDPPGPMNMLGHPQQWHARPSNSAQLPAQQQMHMDTFLATPFLQQQQQLRQQQRQLPQQPPQSGLHARRWSAGAPPLGAGQSSIVPFPRKDSRGQSAKATLPQPRHLDLEVPKAPNDTRPIALFDLNGTLTSHTAKRKSAGINKMRPGIHHLMRLHDTFRIGIFTSASGRTVQTVVPMLETAAGSNGRPLLAEKDFILTRSHTAAAPSSHINMGGNTWDTVKPLNQWFKDLSRVILIDDDSYKAVPGEEDNMIVIPCWENNSDDTVLAALTDALLDIMGNLSPDADVRRYTKAVQETVARAVGQPVGGDAEAGNPEEIDLGDADDSEEEESQEPAMSAATGDAAQQSHLVMV